MTTTRDRTTKRAPRPITAHPFPVHEASKGSMLGQLLGTTDHKMIVHVHPAHPLRTSGLRIPLPAPARTPRGRGARRAGAATHRGFGRHYAPGHCPPR
jgi:hypothetical protein